MKPIHVFFAVATAFIWGLNFVITKIGLQDFPPILFTCLRYTAICLPLVFFTSREGLPWKLIFQVGLFLGTLTFTLAFIGISLGVPAGLTSLVMQSQVIFTVVLSSLFLKDSPNILQKIGLAISFAGLLILAWEFRETPTLVGLLFVLAGALCSGVVKIFMKQGGDYDTFRLMIWMSVVPPIPLLLASLLFETGQWQRIVAASPMGWAAILYNAFISTVLGFGLQGYLIKHYSPNVVTPYSLLVPVFGLITGYLLLGETPQPISVVAALLILVGLAYPRYGRRLASFTREPAR
jgi:O-acetylserine/cysteine efflux transporter